MPSPNVNNAIRIFSEKRYKRASEQQRLRKIIMLQYFQKNTIIFKQTSTSA